MELDLVEELGLALRQIAQAEPVNPVAAVAAVSPELAQMISSAVDEGLQRSAKKATSKNRRKLAIAVIGALWTLLATDYSDAGHNLETVKNAVEGTLHYVARHGTTPRPKR